MRPRPQSALIYDAMGPLYLRRAHVIGHLHGEGDWPEAYLLAQALRCRIDVYWPAEDSAWLGRYALGTAYADTGLRLCLLREAESWTPLVGAIPDAGALQADWAMAQSLVVPDGPDALFDAVNTTYLLSPPPHAFEVHSAALRAQVAEALGREGHTPYAQRDPALMQMLALMPHP